MMGLGPTANRSVFLIVLMLPFDLAVPEDGFSQLFLRPLMCVIALLAAGGLVATRSSIRWDVAGAALVAGLGLCAAAVAAANPWLASSVLVRLVLVLLVVVFIASLGGDEQFEHQFARIVAAMVLLSASVGVVVLVAGEDVLLTGQLVGRISTTGGVDRLTRPFSQTNIAAMVFAPAAVFLATHLAVVRERRANEWLLMAAVLAGAVATVLTLSRGGIAAMIGGFILAGVVLGKRREQGFAALFLAAFGAAATVIVWASMSNGRFRQEMGLDRSPRRTEMWEQALEAFNQSPFFGVGPGHFGSFWLENPLDEVAAAPHAHNLALELLSTTGIVGTISALPFIALVLKSLLADRSREALPAQLALVAALAHAVVDYPLVFTSSGVWFAVLVGLNLRRSEAIGVGE